LLEITLAKFRRVNGQNLYWLTLYTCRLSIDDIYKHTVGYLIEHDWVKPPVADKNKNSLPNLLGAKQTILLYAGVLIIIGLFIIWNRNN
jgi:hypothetical protein